MRRSAHRLALILAVALAPACVWAQSVAFQRTPTRLAGPSGATTTASAVAYFAPCLTGGCAFDIASVRLQPSPPLVYAFKNSTLEQMASFYYGNPASPSCFAAGDLVPESLKVDEVAFCNNATSGADVYGYNVSSTDLIGQFVISGEVVTGALVIEEYLTSATFPLILAGTKTLKAINLSTSVEATWLRPRQGVTERLQSLRLSPAAVEDGDHGDVTWSQKGIPWLQLLWLVTASVSEISGGFFLPVEIQLDAPPNGAGALDADGDGRPDLWVSIGPSPASLLFFHNDGIPENLPAAAPTEIGTSLGLSDPRYVKEIKIINFPGLAIADAGLAEVVVVTTYSGGGLLTWRCSTGGLTVRDIWVENVTGGGYGSDLVVAYDTGDIDVFAGDFPPQVRWATGMPPTTVPMGSTVDFAFEAKDEDGAIANGELFVRGVADPVATGPFPLDQVPSTWIPLTLTAPPGALCDSSGSVTVLARATDEPGAFDELTANVTLTDVAPNAAITGAPGPLRIALAPGGTAIALEALSSDPCNRPLGFRWTDDGLPTGAVVGPDEAASQRGVHPLSLPESTYPAILALANWTATSTVVPSTPLGLPGAPASIGLEADASGLLVVEQTSDRVALGPGDLALLTITVSNTLSVDLPRVRIVDALDGLVATGKSSVEGATAISTAYTSDRAEWTLDAVPAGARVAITLPVRCTLALGAAGRALAFAEGGAPLSRSGSVTVRRPVLPGCGCGQSSGAPLVLAALAAWLSIGFRRPWRARGSRR